MMTANRFKIPDLILITKRNAIGFISAIFFQKMAQPFDAFASRFDIRQYQGDKILFANPAVRIVRVDSQYTGIGRSGFGCGHGNIGGIDATGRKNTSTIVSIGHGRILERIFRQLKRKAGRLRGIVARLLLWLDDNKALWIKRVAIVFLTTDQSRSINRGCLSSQKSRTGMFHCDPFLNS